jgi:hypothetical protein
MFQKMSYFLEPVESLFHSWSSTEERLIYCIGCKTVPFGREP